MPFRALVGPADRFPAPRGGAPHSSRSAFALVGAWTAALLVGTSPSLGAAEEWSFIGARYQGMGGAGVAMVDDEHASYWNPGALAFKKTYGGAVTMGAQVAAEGSVLQDIDRVANFLDDLSDGEFDQLIDDLEAGNPIDPNQLATAIKRARFLALLPYTDQHK